MQIRKLFWAWALVSLASCALIQKQQAVTSFMSDQPKVVDFLKKCP